MRTTQHFLYKTCRIFGEMCSLDAPERSAMRRFPWFSLILITRLRSDTRVGGRSCFQQNLINSELTSLRFEKTHLNAPLLANDRKQCRREAPPLGVVR